MQTASCSLCTRRLLEMQTLVALVLVASTACSYARPPGASADTALAPLEIQDESSNEPSPQQTERDLFTDYLLPKLLLPLNFDENQPFSVPFRPSSDWLNKIQGLNRYGQVEDEIDNIRSYDTDVGRWIIQDAYEEGPVFMQEQYVPQRGPMDLTPRTDLPLVPLSKSKKTRHSVTETKPTGIRDRKKLKFALTPLDRGYFQRDSNSTVPPMQNNEVMHYEGNQPIELEPPRQIRQNPNLSKQKNLLGTDIEQLKVGLANKDYRIPVSLLPSNLQLLKLNQPVELDDDEERSNTLENNEDKPRLQAAPDSAESIYDIALIAAVGAALTMAIFGFAFGWYSLSKRAKAAADVDYPAYGVTGPTMDNSGDRKLAQSAHMYHYQHQKQQIIAMERNGIEQRTGSVSDPESEEENEEGDYTVYECPGFATTGDMEVKNPLFSEDPTPATPGKCEVVKPQPKE